MTKKVLLSKEINPAGMKLLDGKAEIITLKKFDVETIKDAVSDVIGIVLRTNIQINQEIIDAAPLLKIISRTGVGVDNVDVVAASKRGIMVCNTLGINTNSVAEHSFALIIALAKQLKVLDNAVSRGEWKKRYTSKAVDLEDKTLGLVGSGHIGRLLAKKCRIGFDMKVIAYDPYVKNLENIELVPTIDRLFSQSDFVSIHVPLTDETHHLVDHKLFNIMKPTSYIINTSRGSVINENDLIEALEKNSIAGAGIDVFEKEPPLSANPLLKFENVILTPHTAGLNRDCERKNAIQSVQAVIDVLEGRTPLNIYNKKELIQRNH